MSEGLQLAGLACLGLAAEGLQLRPSPVYMSEGLQLVGLAAEGLQRRPTSCKPSQTITTHVGRCHSSPTSCKPSDRYIGLSTCKPTGWFCRKYHLNFQFTTCDLLKSAKREGE